MTEEKRVYGIQKEFDCFTKRTLKYIAMSILRRLKRMEGHRPEVTFFDDLGYEPLYEEDTFKKAEEKYEKIGEYEVPLGNESLIKALKKLKDKDKGVIILYYFSGLSPDEIAENLGLSKDQVYNHKSKSLKRLKKYILEDKDEN